MIPRSTRLVLCCLLFLSACGAPPAPAPASQAASAPAAVLRAPRFAWRWRNPIPQGNPLRALAGLGPGELLAAGDAGALLYTNTGGERWERIDPGFTADIHGLFSAGSSELIAVGAGGLLRRSTDRGRTWPKLSVAVSTDLHAVFGLQGVRLVVGDQGTLLRAQDGGAWSSSQISPSNLYAVWGMSASGGPLWFAAGDAGTLLRSTDNGKTWEPRPTGTRYALRAIAGSGADELLVSGDQGTLLRSFDQGETWELLQPNTPSHLYGLWSPQPGEWYAVGQFGNIVHSRDSGTTWSVLQLGDFTRHPRDLFAVWGASPSEVYAVGTEGLVLRQVEPGAWAALVSLPREDWFGVLLSKDGLWLAGAQGTLARAPRAGRVQSLPSAGVAHFEGLALGAEGRPVAVGSQGAIVVLDPAQLRDDAPQILRAPPASLPAEEPPSPGSNRRKPPKDDKAPKRPAPSAPPAIEIIQRASGTDADLLDVWGQGDDLLAVGARGTLLLSGDGGITWHPADSGGQFLLCGAFGKGDARYAVGDKGTFLRSPDAGQTWTRTVVGDESFIWMNGVAAGKTLLLVGQHGALARSLDDGASWEILDSGTPHHLAAVAVGPGGLYAAGQRGTLLYSKDGQRWIPVELPTHNDLFAITVSSDGALFVAGDDGVVLEGALRSF